MWIIIKNKEECKQRAVAQRNENIYIDVECALVWVCMYEKEYLACLRSMTLISTTTNRICSIFINLFYQREIE